MKKRYFIVSPLHEEDTLWQLCVTTKRDKLTDIYEDDTYDVIAGDISLRGIKRIAKKMDSKNPRIL